jgi:hypothetical protein
LEFQLVLEHVHDRRLEIVSIWFAESDFHFRTASSLSFDQQCTKEGAAGVRIYLDQLWALGGKMEVVAHEYTNWTAIMPSDLGSPRQGRVSIAR